jgi:putative SOS response-associated peptidase YedK
MGPIHDRLPVILPAAACDQWPDPTDDTEALATLLVPAPAKLLVCQARLYGGQQHAQRLTSSNQPNAHYGWWHEDCAMQV